MQAYRKYHCEAAFILLVVLVCMPFLLLSCREAAVNSRNNYIRSEFTLEEQGFAEGAERPPTIKTLYAMARIFTTQGNDKQAELLLRQVIREQPNFMPARNQLAELMMRQRRVNEASSTISEGLKINPNDPVLLNNLGMCFLIRREYNRSLEMFTAAAGIEPENARYRANMALSLVLLDRDEEALSLYKQILPEKQAIHNLEVIKASQKEMTPVSSSR